MRRTMILVVSLLAFGGISIAAPAISSCSIVGTKDRDILAGTKGHDLICALGGGDYVHANGKGDRIFGMGGADTLVGGNGRDKLVGGGGPDKLFAIDQVSGNDVAKGGAGNDRCFIDQGDKTYGCEHVYVGNSPKTTQSLSSSFLGVTELGEEAQATEPGPPPVSPSAPPGSGPSFPACTPPPGQPPDFC